MEMKLEEAVKIINQVANNFKATYQEHVAIQEALKVIVNKLNEGLVKEKQEENA